MKQLVAFYATCLLICTAIAANGTEDSIAQGMFALYKVKPANANQFKILLGLNSHPGDSAVIFLDFLHIGKSSLVLIHPSNGSTYEAIFNQHGIKYTTKGPTAIKSISTIQPTAQTEAENAIETPSLKMSPGVSGVLEEHKTTKTEIERMGYTVETHEVTTEDGYILTYYRIPHGKHNAGQGATKGPVMLQHGMTTNSFCWILQSGEDKILPLMLAEDGYDVWIGNCRGTSYSQKHVNMSSDNRSYWLFSWEEMGLYDIPAAIDYILGKTSKQKLHYIGHSMGTTQFFVMSALKPEYNAKIKLMTAFAPAAYLANINGPLKVLPKVVSKAKFDQNGEIIHSEIGDKECKNADFLKAIHKYSDYKCPASLKSRGLCNNIFYVVYGWDEQGSNSSMIPYVSEHAEDKTSVKTWFHYLQHIGHKRFARYDYGKRVNLKKYGTEHPPSFDTAQMNVPIAIYWGPKDWVTHPKDVEKLSNELPQVVYNYKVPEDGFDHSDFITGVNANEVVYKPAIEFMNQFQN